MLGLERRHCQAIRIDEGPVWYDQNLHLYNHPDWKCQSKIYGYNRFPACIDADISGFEFLEELDDVTADRLRVAFRSYRLLLIRERDLSAENQARVANIFGDVVIREDYDVDDTKEDET